MAALREPKRSASSSASSSIRKAAALVVAVVLLGMHSRVARDANSEELAQPDERARDGFQLPVDAGLEPRPIPRPSPSSARRLEARSGEQRATYGSPPRTADALPYAYAKVTSPGAPRFKRLPTPRERQLIADSPQGRWPAVIERRMKGIYFVALDRVERSHEESYYRTVRGRYVRIRDVKPVVAPAMQGEPLGAARRLPLAFVFGEERPVFCEAGPTLAEDGDEKGRALPRCGSLRKHARFEPAGTIQRNGQQLVAIPSGELIARDAVRIARRISPPEGIPPAAKWMHIDLSQQTLVAYEGDTAVFATLVSSGREGHYTPTGLYRIIKKHVSVTMQGQDDEEGWYEVAEVPWTMWYREVYAVHGAYWHDDFGQPRSHGCTNLAPVDARWLFRWSADWKKKGTWVYFTV